MSTMSSQITAFVETTNIFDVVQNKDRKKISNRVTVSHLKGICNAIISLTSVPDCLADSVGTMKIAHRNFIQDSPKGQKRPLQAMLLPVAVATAAAQDAAASTSPCCFYFIDAIAVALPEDDETTEDVGTGCTKQREAYLATKLATLYELAIELRTMSLVFLVL